MTRQKITREIAIAIYTSSEKSEYLSAIHGISRSAIMNIWSRRSWRRAKANLTRAPAHSKVGRPRKRDRYIEPREENTESIDTRIERLEQAVLSLINYLETREHTE